jgi:3-isopropylmalate/(R)-2-methylmalate dehydratase small subunit
MEKFEIIHSTAIPLREEDIDTDQIIPSRYLKAITKEGLGKFLFFDWRYDRQGARQTSSILNNSLYSGSILLAGQNFGCGSSREHAAWALYDYGFRVIISVRIADIFRNNALNNGLLPVEVSQDFMEELFVHCESNPGTSFQVDLPNQEVSVTGTNLKAIFQIPVYRKQCLLNGFDNISYLLSMTSAVENYEKQSKYLELIS